MITILEVLQNAEHNFRTCKTMGGINSPLGEMAAEQLSNAIKALESGKSPEDNFEPQNEKVS